MRTSQDYRPLTWIFMDLVLWNFNQIFHYVYTFNIYCLFLSLALH